MSSHFNVDDLTVMPQFNRLRRTKGVRDYTETLYLLFNTLVDPSLITESKYHIQRYKNKTTTVVVFTVSILTFSSPIYIYIIKAQNLQVMDPYKCAGPIVCGRSRTSSSVATRIKTRAKLYV